MTPTLGEEEGGVGKKSLATLRRSTLQTPPPSRCVCVCKREREGEGDRYKKERKKRERQREVDREGGRE